MESTSVGALIGSVLAIFIVHRVSHKKLQTSGFLILGTMFVIVGALYVTLEGTRANVVVIVFYGICQLFFNLGVPRITFLGGKHANKLMQGQIRLHSLLVFPRPSIINNHLT